MTEDERAPLDGARWGKWTWRELSAGMSSGGRGPYLPVTRVSCLGFSNLPATDWAVALKLMNSDDPERRSRSGMSLTRGFTTRLRALVSLIDQTRRLIGFPRTPWSFGRAEPQRAELAYPRDAAGGIPSDLRNYLLHFGVPPIVQNLTLNMAGGATVGAFDVTGHSIRLSAQKLLEWDKLGRKGEGLPGVIWRTRRTRAQTRCHSALDRHETLFHLVIRATCAHQPGPRHTGPLFGSAE